VSGFIEWLEELNKNDTKVRAVLRRSLAFDPGEFPAAFPFVEPFLKNEDNPWRRQMIYLVAGLWAVHWRKDRSGAPISLGKACAIYYEEESKSTSTERRFITLLDADSDQLPHRLRQMVALLKDCNLDFEALLTGLWYWNNDQKRTQNQWARDFYRNLKHEKETEAIVAKEGNE
jgi:CRISPR system Cascade subunit CasB